MNKLMNLFQSIKNYKMARKNASMISIEKVEFEYTHFSIKLLTDELLTNKDKFFICRENNNKKELAYLCNDKEIVINMAYNECNLILDRIFFETETMQIEIPISFEFDLSKQNDIHYMNKIVFSASTRKKGNELFYFLFCVLTLMSKESKFYLGILSVLSYRIAESPIDRNIFGLEIISRRIEAINIFDHSKADPVLLRWIISSGYAVSVLCLYYKLPDKAKLLLASITPLSRYSSLNHMVYWNLAASLMIKGYLHFGNNEIEEAKLTFMELCDLTERGVRDIYSTRNEALVTQTADCIALIEIGSQAYISAFVCFNGRFPLESKFITPKYIDNYYIDFVSSVKRFDKAFPPKLAILMNIKNKFNNQLKEILGKS